MALTTTETALYDCCNSNDFIPLAKLQQFQEQLKAEGNLNTLIFALKKFIQGRCPNCQAQGAFKWHFLGALNHPDCGYSWYANPGSYSVKQLKSSLYAGRAIAGHTLKEGWAIATLGFVVGVAFRLPLALMLIPIQAVVYLTNRKSSAPASAK